MMPGLAGQFVVEIGTAQSDRLDRPEPRLTPHEVRIIGMLSGGDSYEQVGHRLGVTVNTVRNYIRSIYAKLDVHTKSEAVSKALRARIIL